MCEQLAQGCYLNAERPGIEPALSSVESQVERTPLHDEATLHGLVVQWPWCSFDLRLDRAQCRFNSRPFRIQVTTLHKLFTHTQRCGSCVLQVRDSHRAQNVPMYVIVTDDKLASEPEPGSLRCKTSGRRQQQIRAGRRSSVSAERYDPERDAADTADLDDSTLVVVPKTPDQRRRLADAVRDILLFRSISSRNRAFKMFSFLFISTSKCD